MREAIGSTLDDVGGDWVRWLIQQDYTLESRKWGGKIWRLEPVEAKLFVVWSPQELRELVEVYPHPEMDERNSKFREFGGEGEIYLWVDWEKMAEEYDGFHIPNPWPWRFDGDDHPASMFFYSMDAECTCWFRWCFEGDPVELDPEPFLAKLKGDDE